MYTAVRVQEKGQVTIPTEIRKKLNLLCSHLCF